MHKLLTVLVFLSALLAACGQNPTPAPTAAATVIEVPAITQTPQSPPTTAPTLAPTISQPLVEYGPSNFPADINPLTGLKVANPALLDRRPMLIKVSNLPRDVRPQWGLSLADIVFEYYTEEGTTRFAALFYGNDAQMVGPIRSGRFIDAHLVRGYKAVFGLVGADPIVMTRFLKSEFADRVVTEGPSAPITRYEPNGMNHAVVNTAELSAYATKKGIGNGRQDLNGMSFNLAASAAGQPGTQAIVRYSGAIYNRWDYDPASGKYLRFSDNADAVNGIESEQYLQATDRQTNQPVAFDNVVFLYVTHELYKPGIYDILLSGSGAAVAFRDGQVYQVTWHRNDTDVVSLTNPDGTPFAFKPGTTWFEVIGFSSTAKQTNQSWRFTHQMP
jgi:hypothetical protein